MREPVLRCGLALQLQWCEQVFINSRGEQVRRCASIEKMKNK